MGNAHKKSRKLGLNTPQIMGLDIQKFIESVKLHIPHQLKPYSSVKPI